MNYIREWAFNLNSVTYGLGRAEVYVTHVY